MNILLVGNSILLTSVRVLPKLLNQLPEKEDLCIKSIYVAGARLSEYNKRFEKSLIAKFKDVGKFPNNRLWTYEYGNPKYLEVGMPVDSVKDIIKEKDWDKIVFCEGSSEVGKKSFSTSIYPTFASKVRSISKADLYFTYQFVPSPFIRSAKFLYTGQLGGATTRSEMYKFLNDNQDKICTENNLKAFPLRKAYEKLVEAFPENRYSLIVDRIHPDTSLGEYFCAGYFYNFFLRDIYQVSTKELKYSKAAKPGQYPDGSPSIPVNTRTKEICDNILDELFISK